MLDESGVLLEEEVIFADVETGELYFAFYPGGLQIEDSIRSWRISFWSISIMDRSRQ